MGSCSTQNATGLYGDNAYGEGSGTCVSPADQVGYGAGGLPCDLVSTTGLVGTITNMTPQIWIGHRSPEFGGATFQASTYPECKKLVGMCVTVQLREEWVQTIGQPIIVYLYIP